MSKIEQALREWAEDYNLAAINYRGGVDAIVAIGFLAHKILEATAPTNHKPTCPRSSSYEVGSGLPWDCTCDDLEPAPRTFGDLEVGDWFDNIWMKTGPSVAVDEFGLFAEWEAHEIVHPFEWEWV